jgi:hypothetical protein
MRKQLWNFTILCHTPWFKCMWGEETGNKSQLIQWPYTGKLMIPATAGFGPNQHNENEHWVCKWTSDHRRIKTFIWHYSTGKPISGTQKVYAFLPIKESVFVVKKSFLPHLTLFSIVCTLQESAAKKKTKLKVSWTFLVAMMSFVRERKLNGTENSFLQLYDSSESYCILNDQIEYFCVRYLIKILPRTATGQI